MAGGSRGCRHGRKAFDVQGLGDRLGAALARPSRILRIIWGLRELECIIIGNIYKITGPIYRGTFPKMYGYPWI